MSAPTDLRINWTARQREVLDLLAQGKTNPEIARDLEITLDGAKFHVSEIMNRLGVNHREDATAYWRANKPTLLRRLVRVITGAALWKYAAAGAGVLLLGALAVGLVLAANSDDDPTDSTEEVEATPSDDPPSSLQIEDAGDAFTVTNFGQDETIDKESAAIFVDTGTGAAEAITLVPSLGLGEVQIPEGTDRWVYTPDYNGDAFLFDRWMERSFTWSSADYSLFAATDSMLAFGPVQGASPPFQVSILDPDMATVRQVDVPDAPAGTANMVSATFSPDGERLVFSLLVEDSLTSSPPMLLDIVTGALTELPPPVGELPADFTLGRVTFSARPTFEDFFVVTSQFQNPENPDDPSNPRQNFTQRFDWSGSRLGEPVRGMIADVSPDGRYGLSEDLFASYCIRAGVCLHWPALVFTDMATGEPLFRLKGASLHSFGPWSGHWFADGQSFIATVAGTPDVVVPTGGRYPLSFLEVGIDGRVIRRLDQQCPNCFAFPSPFSRNVIALGNRVILGPTGFTGIEVTDVLGPAGITSVEVTGQHAIGAPWGPSSDTMRLTVTLDGESANDGPQIQLLPNPVLEFPPFDDEVRLQAAFVDGACLNILDTGGSPVACVDEGTVLVESTGTVGRLGPAADPTSGPEWIYVRTEDGAEVG